VWRLTINEQKILHTDKRRSRTSGDLTTAETKTPTFIPDIKPYRSPITGEPITSRPKERAHMAEHGVTRAQDYSPQWYEQKGKERELSRNCATAADRADRIAALKHALERSQ
jgi:hypothetical protein